MINIEKVAGDIEMDVPVWIEAEGEAMEFTGVVDKNGTGIYESDIVRDSEETYEVVWAEYEVNEYTVVGWALKNDKTTFGFSSEDSSVLEQIGTTYQTPELINQ